MEDSKNKNMDDDILRSREDILRAQGSQKKDNQSEQKTDNQREKEPADIPAGKEQKHQDILKDKRTEQKKTEHKPPSDSELPTQHKTEIPQFDLAEQIMAEQRKITAARRTPPEQNKKPPRDAKQKQQDFRVENKIKTTKPYCMKIVSEIVSRDITRLSRENK